MWYWKVPSQNAEALRFFDGCYDACADLNRWYASEPRADRVAVMNARLIHIPESENQSFITIGVEMFNGSLIPSIPLFPQERDFTEIFNDEANSYVNSIKPRFRRGKL